MIENIPGLYFIGNQKKPNNKIKVEHIIADYSDPDRTRKTGSDHEDLSITDSSDSDPLASDSFDPAVLEHEGQKSL